MISDFRSVQRPKNLIKHSSMCECTEDFPRRERAIEWHDQVLTRLAKMFMNIRQVINLFPLFVSFIPAVPTVRRLKDSEHVL